jgi:hypothetical protein
VSKPDQKWFCVFDDNGSVRGMGYDTNAEAVAYEDALDYCQISDLRTLGVYQADSEESAIEQAKAENEFEDYDDEEDEGCPRCDPDCMGNAEDSHEACEWPEGETDA